MYLTINDYTWIETMQEVHIEVPLRGIPAKNIDSMITSRYIKLILKPYIFECVLENSINVEASKLELSGGCARFILNKATSGIWGRLASEDMKNRSKLCQIKSAAVEEHQKYEQERLRMKHEVIRKGQKEALSNVMKLESAERERISNEKNEAARQAIDDLVQSQATKQPKPDQIKQQLVEAREYARELASQRNPPPTKTREKQSWLSVEKPIELPVRTSTTIPFTFTPRVFPTPERESLKLEEEEWLNKQAEHRRAMLKRVLPSGEMSEQEMDPLWLRKKGDSLFKAGDFEAAVEAYSRAIGLDPKMHTAYSNRAACHLQLGNFFKALEDSSTALDLCRPPVPQNLRSRIRAHVRRGAAFCHLKMYKESLIEYEAAQKLDPTDDTIQIDKRNIEEHLNGLRNAGL